eukprot:1187049-Prorocentrum_minimum.AAC.1
MYIECPLSPCKQEPRGRTESRDGLSRLLTRKQIQEIDSEGFRSRGGRPSRRGGRRFRFFDSYFGIGLNTDIKPLLGRSTTGEFNSPPTYLRTPFKWSYLPARRECAPWPPPPDCTRPRASRGGPSASWRAESAG